MSSINPDDDIYNASLLIVNRRSAIKNRKRISEIGELYRMPITA